MGRTKRRPRRRRSIQQTAVDGRDDSRVIDKCVPQLHATHPDALPRCPPLPQQDADRCCLQQQAFDGKEREGRGRGGGSRRLAETAAAP